MEKTGNRWRDPDKVYNPDGSLKPREEWDKAETLANEANVDLNVYKGKDAGRKRYGPAVTANGTPPEPAPEAEGGVATEAMSHNDRMAAAIAASQKAPLVTDDLPEIPAGKLNPHLGRETLPAGVSTAAPGLAVSPPAIDDLKEVMDTLRRVGPLAQSGDAAAVAEVEKIGQAEYSRDGGARTPVSKRLNALGIKKPR